jgi:hypothetical protein
MFEGCPTPYKGWGEEDKKGFSQRPKSMRKILVPFFSPFPFVKREKPLHRLDESKPMSEQFRYAVAGWWK